MVPDEPRFTLEVHPWEGGGTRVAAAGELDLAFAAQFGETVAAQLADGRVLLDLRELQFMDSSGIAALDALLRTSESQGWTLLVSPELQPPVRRILEMTGMLEGLVMEDGG